jgi:1-acyl-sn-glycerol-3-phosphate acyltransferase
MDLNRLKQFKLSARPWGQILFARGIVGPGFKKPWSPSQIQFEGIERLLTPHGNYIVMNHTDRYTCWPLQHHLLVQHDRFTSAWVKTKYYQNPAIAWFLDRFNNIPVPSRGHLITQSFETLARKEPSHAAYEILKRVVESEADFDLQEAIQTLSDSNEKIALEKLLKPNEVSGAERYAQTLKTEFDSLMKEVVRLNQEALNLGLDIIVFPEGTRRPRVSKGFTGAAQMILATGASVIPVGASGVDRLFPGASPISRGGSAKLRVGHRMRPGLELKPFEEGAPFTPFTLDAKKQEGRFQALTDHLMDRVNELVDPEYQRLD